MSVKVRKVGNSYTVSIPAGVVKQLDIFDGQIMDVVMTSKGFEYRIAEPVPSGIDWASYQYDGAPLRDGMDPDEYVRSLRNDDRE